MVLKKKEGNLEMEILYFDTLTYAQGDMYVVASDEGLVYIGTPNAAFDEVKEWAKTIQRILF